jgi:D-xylose transport system permease protein
VLFGCRFGAINPTALQGEELTVIAAAILGGTSLFGGAGSVVKTVAGALLLFTLTNGFNILNLGANYQGVIEGTALIIAAAIYTLGGRRRARWGRVASSRAPIVTKITKGEAV